MDPAISTANMALTMGRNVLGGHYPFVRYFARFVLLRATASQMDWIIKRTHSRYEQRLRYGAPRSVIPL